MSVPIEIWDRRCSRRCCRRGARRPSGDDWWFDFGHCNAKGKNERRCSVMDEMENLQGDQSTVVTGRTRFGRSLRRVMVQWAGSAAAARWRSGIIVTFGGDVQATLVRTRPGKGRFDSDWNRSSTRFDHKLVFTIFFMHRILRSRMNRRDERFDRRRELTSQSEDICTRSNNYWWCTRVRISMCRCRNVFGCDKSPSDLI